MIEKTPLENWIRTRIFPGDKFLSRDRLDVYQVSALKDCIIYAANNSHYYKKHLAGINADDIKDLRDIRMLPFMDARDICHYGKKIICVVQGEISRIVTLDTSGTTGSPKRIYFTHEDQELTIDFFHYGMSVFTQRHDRVLVLLPGVRPGSIGDLLNIGLSRMQAETLILGIVDDFSKAEQVIIDEEINVIVGVPQQVFALAKMNKAKIIKAKGCLHSVLLSTDYIPSATVNLINQNWGCRVYEHYGMTEMGLGGGVFCKAMYGYHMREADMLFEIVDPDTGLPVKDGCFGEVVFTTLTRKGMPLIRYRTGDISRFIAEPCACGTVLKTMDRVQYRIASTIRLRGGHLLTMSELDECLFGVEGIIDFDAVLTMHENMEILVLKVKISNTMLKIDDTIRTALRKSGLKEILARGELAVRIDRMHQKETDKKGIRKRNILDER